jgi:hypothetical protein
MSIEFNVRKEFNVGDYVSGLNSSQVKYVNKLVNDANRRTKERVFTDLDMLDGDGGDLAGTDQRLVEQVSALAKEYLNQKFPNKPKGDSEPIVIFFIFFLIIIRFQCQALHLLKIKI